MENQPALNALKTQRVDTQFSSNKQPSSEAKKLGWEKRKLSKTIQSALLAELSKEIFDTYTGEVITEAESFAIGLLQEWKTTKDPRYAKLIMDFITKNNEQSEPPPESIQVIIQTSGSRVKND